MLGAIIGDIIGSIYELNNIKTKDFELFGEGVHPTDDSILTLAVAKALTESKDDFSYLEEQARKYLREFFEKYPDAGYGGTFRRWLNGEPIPGGSSGNGAAMRISPVAWAASSLEEAKRMSKAVTRITHSHPEGIKGAEAVTVAIFMARKGSTKEEIRQRIEKEYYHIDFTLDEIRDTYSFDVTCEGTVPYALEAFFEARDYEDAVRNAISIGGDSDTMAAIAGSVAEAYFGIPNEIKDRAVRYLDVFQTEVIKTFQNNF